MRLPLLAAAALAAAASATPASAAFLPACTAHLADAAAGAVASCHSGNTPVRSDTNRVLYVVVESGAVDATIACNGRFPVTRRISAGQLSPLSTTENGSSCRNEIKAVGNGTTAVAVSTFVYAPQQW